MAESVIVHFANATTSDVALALDPATNLERIDVSLPVNLEYLILVYDYPDFDTEYEDEEKRQVISMLGSTPSCSMAFELRRSRQGEACNLFKMLIDKELSTFQFIVDDCMGAFWRQSDIVLRLNEFLRGYRSLS